MLRAFEHGRAVDAQVRVLAVENGEDLVPRGRGTRRDVDAVEHGLTADLGGERRQGQRLVALGIDAHVLHVGAVASDHLHHIVWLMVGAIGALMRFEQGHGRALFHDHENAGGGGNREAAEVTKRRWTGTSTGPATRIMTPSAMKDVLS